MKISIRPAPHSKGCAHVGRDWCSRNDNHPERCETNCPAGYCCEMKHCWEVGEKLRDILVARGHEVMMANKKYRKGTPTSKANDNMKKAMAEIMAWEPELHIAIHTNSYDEVVTGVRIGYPAIGNNKGETERCNASYRLAEEIVKTNKEIYHSPSKVKSCTYNFYELNKPTCPAIYIEGCFANSAKKDGDWWHENMDIIAKSYADGIEAWMKKEGIPMPDGSKPIEPTPSKPEPEPELEESTAIINTKYDSGLSLWDSYKKKTSLIKVAKNEIVKVLSLEPDHNFYYCEYKGVKGYADGQYLLFENKEVSAVYAIINTKYDAGLSLWDSYKKDKAVIKVAKGEKVQVLSTNPDHGFYLCEYKGKEGYADGQYLKFDDAGEYVTAIINTKYDAGLSLWDSYRKNTSLIKVKKGEKVEVKSLNDDHGFYLCEYKDVEGYADGQYLLF